MTAAFRFSNRAVKYVWLSLPGLAALGLSAAWLISVAPDKQAESLQATDWKEEVREQKERADFLQEHQVHSNYDQIILLGLDAASPDTKTRVWEWVQSPTAEVHESGKIIRLLDQYHDCVGYFVSGSGAFLEEENPGLCKVENGDVDESLRTANKL
jgi:formylglycine-generating enzyme required for sulfatase activity